MQKLTCGCKILTTHKTRYSFPTSIFHKVGLCSDALEVWWDRLIQWKLWLWLWKWKWKNCENRPVFEEVMPVKFWRLFFRTRCTIGASKIWQTGYAADQAAADPATTVVVDDATSENAIVQHQRRINTDVDGIKHAIWFGAVDGYKLCDLSTTRRSI